ncbi:hypothetical protein SKAU_G00226980 [Synaphobranchus kaupii]|uniref:PXA domain-containing protein n=1 Tax=Synaphobranchus kaupii TaxID=118154 RepID=A0A9Q1ISL6_SYNKA|nr:hypothetical protein SKAU_G00226980 [Synaphobranchus kaupii]
MYLYVCSIVLTLGLILFFSDFGLFIIKLGCQKLCFMTPTNAITKILHEISTQTDLFQEEILCQDSGKDEYFCCADEIDTTDKIQELAHEVDLQCPNVKKSLQQVFQCAYSQLILTWYSVPESRDNQMLYRALGREFDIFVDRVITRASDINISAIAVDSVRILTQHLHNANQPDRGQLFSSRADELAVLRDLTCCALNEIVALKVFELLVNWLSDPDNLNQLLVSHLDAMTLKSSMDALEELKREDTPSSLDSEGKGVIADATEVLAIGVKPKKKGTNFKKKFSEFVNLKLKETKKKLTKKKKEEPMFRSLGNVRLRYSLDDELPVPCSALYQQDYISDDSDLENCPLSVQEEMIEFKLSYEMWRLSSWVVSVKQVHEEGGELCFIICLEEANNPEKLHWDVSKSRMDIRQFHSSLQDIANLPSIAELLESTERTVNDEFKEQARATLEKFLQGLVKDSRLCQSPEVFQFLCPLEELLTEEEAYGGVWSLLSGLAHILTPAKGDEDVVAQGPAKSDDPGMEGAEPESLAETEDEEADLKGSCDALYQWTANSGGLLPLDSGDNSKSLEEAPDFQAASLPFTEPCEDDSSVRESHSRRDDGGQQDDCTDGLRIPFIARAHKKDRPVPKPSDRVRNKRGKGQLNVGRIEEYRTQESNRREMNQSGKEQREATKAIIDLLKEISGSPILWNICDVILKPFMPLLKRKVNSFLNKMNPTEPQIASYIDRLREKQWPAGVPVISGPGRTDEQKSETKERAHQLINTKCSNAFFLKKNDVEAVFKLFQDTEENKKLFYMLLSFLLRELMPGESALNVKAIAFLNSPV